MKTKVTMTMSEWRDKYHAFADENEDVKHFLYDLIPGDDVEVQMVGKVYDAVVAEIFDSDTDYVASVWYEDDSDGKPVVIVDIYKWDQDAQMRVTVE